MHVMVSAGDCQHETRRATPHNIQLAISAPTGPC